MSCIRCGKDTEENNIFCNECLADMERQPVKPGTPILLPDRETRGTVKRSSFKLAASKWQDKIFRLKYTIFWLILIIILLSAALALCICTLLQITPEWINDIFFNNVPIRTVIDNALQ